MAPEFFEPEAVRKVIVEETPTGRETLPWRLACRYSARTLLAELAVSVQGNQQRFVVGSFHATPGTGKVGGERVGEWKPFFHGGVAITLASLELPFIFAIDANEPFSETAESVIFHRVQSRGVLKLNALLGLTPRHRARDLLREALCRSGAPPAATEYLALTYTTRGGGKRRFDSMWATSEFSLDSLDTYYEEALAAGGDHALIVADLKV